MIMQEILLDALIDTIKLIPFLFLSFILMELIEHKINYQKKLEKINKFGPLAGSLFGLIPQCGFSAFASNLYAARVITLGTIFSIYLSTSDEMLPILISHQVNLKIILTILLTKFCLGFIFGLLVDTFFTRKKSNNIEKICEEDHCHCEDGILKSSLIHTLKISIFIFIINIILNFIIDEEWVINVINGNKILIPFITSIIGLIPNCAASVIITELYLSKVISFGSCIAGLLSSSGVGLLVLFKQNKRLKENLLILLTLVIYASLCGALFNLFL